MTNICHAADKQLVTLVEWAKRIPHFSDLTLEDQVILLRAGKGCGGSVLLGTLLWAAILKFPLGPENEQVEGAVVCPSRVPLS